MTGLHSHQMNSREPGKSSSENLLPETIVKISAASWTIARTIKVHGVDGGGRVAVRAEIRDTELATRGDTVEITLKPLLGHQRC